MIGYKAWHNSKQGIVPVLVVGKEDGDYIIWKRLGKVVVERVVKRDTLYAFDTKEGWE